MRKLSFLAFVGTLALLAGGCGSGETDTSSSPPPTIAPASPTTTPAQPSFDKPVVEGKQQPNADTATDKANAGPVAVAPPELIPPTDPRAQLNRVQRGGKDPFALPEIQLDNPPALAPNGSQQPVPNVRRIPGTPGTPSVAVPTGVSNTRSLPQGRQQPGSARTRVVQARRPVIPPSVEIQSPSRPTTPGPFALQPPGSRRVRSTTTIALQPPSRPATPGSVSLQSPNSAIRRATVARQLAQRSQSPTSVAQQRSTMARRQAIAQQPGRSSTTTRRTAVARTPQRRTTSATTVAARPSIPNRPTASRPNPAARNQGSASTNATPRTPALPVPPEPQIAVLPPPPEPTLARAVEVSGVVQVGNEPQAIIKAPNEATSRYVRVGQRLSNGQVLVKRIEMNQGSEPVVVLEQYGIEVAKVVGERPVAPAQPGTQPTTPTASIPTFS